MRRVSFLYRMFLRKPLWFRTIVGISLLASIVFSSPAIPLGGYSESVSKLAAALFFGTVGTAMRRNRPILLLFVALTALCLYMSWDALPQ